LKVQIFSTPDQIFEKDIEVIEMPLKDRLKRGGKGGGAFFLAAICCAPIPVVHLVLVPLCLFFAVFMLVFRSRQKVEIKAPDLACPSCKAPQALDTFIIAWPYRGYCSSCRAQFMVRPVDISTLEKA
jgi:hypothetical protein